MKLESRQFFCANIARALSGRTHSRSARSFGARSRAGVQHIMKAFVFDERGMRADFLDGV